MLVGDDQFTEEQKIATTNSNGNSGLIYSVPDDDFVNEIIESQRLITNKKYSILLVEDSPDLLDLLVQIFSPI